MQEPCVRKWRVLEFASTAIWTLGGVAVVAAQAHCEQLLLFNRSCGYDPSKFIDRCKDSLAVCSMFPRLPAAHVTTVVMILCTGVEARASSSAWHPSAIVLCDDRRDISSCTLGCLWRCSGGCTLLCCGRGCSGRHVGTGRASDTLQLLLRAPLPVSAGRASDTDGLSAMHSCAT